MVVVGGVPAASAVELDHQACTRWNIRQSHEPLKPVKALDGLERHFLERSSGDPAGLQTGLCSRGQSSDSTVQSIAELWPDYMRISTSHKMGNHQAFPSSHAAAEAHSWQRRCRRISGRQRVWRSIACASRTPCRGAPLHGPVEPLPVLAPGVAPLRGRAAHGSPAPSGWAAHRGAPAAAAALLLAPPVTTRCSVTTCRCATRGFEFTRAAITSAPRRARDAGRR